MSSSGRNSCSSDVTKFDGREEGVREGVEHIITVIDASDGQDIDLFTFLKNLITKAFFVHLIQFDFKESSLPQAICQIV